MREAPQTFNDLIFATGYCFTRTDSQFVDHVHFTDI